MGSGVNGLEDGVKVREEEVLAELFTEAASCLRRPLCPGKELGASDRE